MPPQRYEEDDGDNGSGDEDDNDQDGDYFDGDCAGSGKDDDDDGCASDDNDGLLLGSCRGNRQADDTLRPNGRPRDFEGQRAGETRSVRVQQDCRVRHQNRLFVISLLIIICYFFVNYYLLFFCDI